MNKQTPRTSVTAVRQNGVRRGAMGDANSSGRGGAATKRHTVVKADIFFEKEEHAVGLSQRPRGLRHRSSSLV